MSYIQADLVEKVLPFPIFVTPRTKTVHRTVFAFVPPTMLDKIRRRPSVQIVIKYAPLVFRSRLVGITSICSKISFGLIFLGIILDALGSIGFIFQLAGIIAFAVVTFFQLVTLPTEFDASRRALEIMGNQGILKRDELGGAKSVLDAAAMTYVAALAVSLIQLLRLIMTIRRHD